MSGWAVPVTLVLLASALLGCTAGASGGGPAAAPIVAAPAAGDAAVLHLLQRLTYGPRPGDIARVEAMGPEAWLERQLDPARLDDGAAEHALAALPTLRMSIAELPRAYPRPDAETQRKLASGEMTPREARERYPMDRRPARIIAELQAARMLRAVASERQLQEVMVDFWFNHFNVFAAKGEVRWYLTAYERDVIRPHALGRFPDLLQATARHPAMLFYLDNWLSRRPGFTPRVGPNAGRPAGLNENYARELMELHTLGVDGGYTQADVTEVARAFTGWTIDRPRQEARFVFRASNRATSPSRPISAPSSTTSPPTTSTSPPPRPSSPAGPHPQPPSPFSRSRPSAPPLPGRSGSSTSRPQPAEEGPDARRHEHRSEAYFEYAAARSAGPTKQMGLLQRAA